MSLRRPWLEATLERVLAVGCLGVGTVAIAVAAYRLRNVYVGDAAVYLPYAQHAAAGHFFQFNLAQFSSGATSPLWGVLLGIPYLFGLGLGGAKAFALLAALAAFVAVVACGGRLVGSLAAASVAGLFVVGSMIWYALVLYESALVVGVAALSLAVLGQVMKESGTNGAIRRPTLAALIALWALLPLTRPDAVIVVLAEAVALLLFSPLERRRRAVLTLGSLAVAAVPALTYYGYSFVELGTFSTSASERTFALHEVAKHWLGPLFFSAEPVRRLFATSWAVVAVPGVTGLALLARAKATRWLGVVGALVSLSYVFLLTFVSPGLFDTPRYLLPLAPILVVGCARFLTAFRQPGRRLVVLCLAALLIGGIGCSDLRNRTNKLRMLGLTSNEVFERVPVDIVNRLAHPGDTLLAYEAQLRYDLRGDVAVLSEDGITDAKVRPYQSRHAMTAFLRRYRPQWWIADRNVSTRPYMRGSVLDRVYRTFMADMKLKQLVVNGIRFQLVARRTAPPAPGFGSWQLLFHLRFRS